MSKTYGYKLPGYFMEYGPVAAGNVDEANITDAERETGVNIEDIVKGDK